MAEKYFRGFHAIAEVVERMVKLADHQQKFHPHESLRLFRKDYDLLARWPKAAAMHGVMVEGETLVFKGFTLTYDRTQKRYQSDVHA